MKKYDPKTIQSPLARARGLGSAHDGVDHWFKQRLTAIANIPLVLWLVYNIVNLRTADYDVFTAWLGQPVNAILMILFTLSTFYHAKLGSQVVIEDYIHNEAFKMVKLIGQKLIFVALGVACIFSVMKIAFS